MPDRTPLSDADRLPLLVQLVDGLPVGWRLRVGTKCPRALWAEHESLPRGGVDVGQVATAGLAAQFVTAVSGSAAMDAAAHSVWLHGNWRWLTRQMTTEEREAFADAVDRVIGRYNLDDGDDPDLNVRPVDRWWRDAPASPPHDARVRARVAEEIAQALETHKRRSGGQPPATTILREAAARARQHATPPTTEETDHAE